MPTTNFWSFSALSGCVGRLRLAAILALSAHGALAASPPTHGFRVLYRFTGGQDGGDPTTPGLAIDASGNLYGTTQSGGTGNGVFFQLSPDGTQTVLYSFSGGFGGGQPNSPLVADDQGNFYGTTHQGGTRDSGVVFKITPFGSLQVLHDFKGGRDGASPYGGLIISKQGYLYGTTTAGGANNAGTVFSVRLDGEFYKVLYAFSGGADGGMPLGGVIRDKAGNLYGTTDSGGATGWGTVFKLAPGGTETVLYAFTGGTDGGEPYAGLLADSSGNFYGTTPVGGTSPNRGGTVFKLTPAGSMSVVYSFTFGADGGQPGQGSLVQDAKGNLYGTTIYGGAQTGLGNGVVYEVAPNGTETVLHAFTGGKGGGMPFEGLLEDASTGVSYLYGATEAGGRKSGAGTIFRLRN
jgi:uncharacterized repeat protein (TIGR03803 family)